MHNYKKLRLWELAVDLTAVIYEISSSFPSAEKFGLTSQIRNAAVSIPSNIAEGAGRNTKKDFARFISIATGSCYETETQLIVAIKLKFIQNANQAFDMIEDLQKMLYRFYMKLCEGDES